VIAKPSPGAQALGIYTSQVQKKLFPFSLSLSSSSGQASRQRSRRPPAALVPRLRRSRSYAQNEQIYIYLDLGRNFRLKLRAHPTKGN